MVSIAEESEKALKQRKFLSERLQNSMKQQKLLANKGMTAQIFCNINLLTR